MLDSLDPGSRGWLNGKMAITHPRMSIRCIGTLSKKTPGTEGLATVSIRTTLSSAILEIRSCPRLNSMPKGRSNGSRDASIAGPSSASSGIRHASSAINSSCSPASETAVSATRGQDGLSAITGLRPHQDVGPVASDLPEQGDVLGCYLLCVSMSWSQRFSIPSLPPFTSVPGDHQGSALAALRARPLACQEGVLCG